MIQLVSTSPDTIQDPNIGRIVVLVDTSSPSWSSGGILNLPGSPVASARVLIKDEGGQAAAKPIVVSGAGKLIDTVSTRQIQNPFEALLLAYDGTKWVVI